MVLNAWSKIPGLIPENEIIQVFKDKCRHLKAREEKDKDVTVVDSDEGDISDEEWLVEILKWLATYIISYICR